MTRPNYQIIAQGALAIAAMRLRVPKWVKRFRPAVLVARFRGNLLHALLIIKKGASSSP